MPRGRSTTQPTEYAGLWPIGCCVRTNQGTQATAHGNEPSRGAKIDAEIQAEEAEMLKKKNARGTDSMPGKKF